MAELNKFTRLLPGDAGLRGDNLLFDIVRWKTERCRREGRRRERPGITRKQASELVRFGHAIRRLENAGLREVASTRVLIAAGRLIADDLHPAKAARAAIAGPLSDDAATTAGLIEMIDVYFSDPGDRTSRKTTS